MCYAKCDELFDVFDIIVKVMKVATPNCAIARE